VLANKKCGGWLIMTGEDADSSLFASIPLLIPFPDSRANMVLVNAK
jgi:hypothetical protein